jgi:transposase
MDNVRPHIAKKVAEFLAGNGMKRAPHPLYSPIEPPVTSAFSGTSRASSQVHHSSPINFCRRLMRFFQSVEKVTLERMFQEWMDGLGQCYVTADDLVEGMYKV